MLAILPGIFDPILPLTLNKSNTEHIHANVENHLLSMDSFQVYAVNDDPLALGFLIKSVRIYFQYISMPFGFDKYAVVEI